MKHEPGAGTDLDQALVRAGRYLRRGVVSADLRTLEKTGGREADSFYRDRWSYDKVVRSTHGVNCTGSCSWKVYVKDGIITWEAQQTDYPSAGPDRPDYEPRGCPRGAAFSWYTYSPTRVRYPYVRGVLLQMFREAKAQHDGDPVRAWEHIVENPLRAKAYKSARGKGGLVGVAVRVTVAVGPGVLVGPLPPGSVPQINWPLRYIVTLVQSAKAVLVPSNE